MFSQPTGFVNTNNAKLCSLEQVHARQSAVLPRSHTYILAESRGVPLSDGKMATTFLFVKVSFLKGNIRGLVREKLPTAALRG